ncbi:hypothetical protein [Lactobacillus sp.]|uniref:hypothetical protein n=1 Tax=Lactobacillus sp. TaxID=1591 RepID=UPI0025EC6BA1|nr:hypothetical protein [Lactobacillus sp.]MCO6532397.1 hypothetical protein [Lactobacillus sp.]
MTFDDYNLTRDAKYLVSVLYKEYLSRRKQGKTKEESGFFLDIRDVQKLIPHWSIDDATTVCNELKTKELIDCRYGSNRPVYIHLTSDAISMLENKFKNNMKTVLGYIKDFKDIFF